MRSVTTHVDGAFGFAVTMAPEMKGADVCRELRASPLPPTACCVTGVAGWGQVSAHTAVWGRPGKRGRRRGRGSEPPSHAGAEPCGGRAP